MHASGILDFLLDRTALLVGGLRKVDIDLQLLHIGLQRVAWLQVGVVKSFFLRRITSAGIKKNQSKGILKVIYCFIPFWHRHFDDFRQHGVVDLRCYEYELCLFDTQTCVVFILF